MIEGITKSNIRAIFFAWYWVTRNTKNSWKSFHPLKPCPLNKKLWIKKNSNLKNITVSGIQRTKWSQLVLYRQPSLLKHEIQDRFPDNALLKSWSFSHAKFIELQILTDGLCVMCKPWVNFFSCISQSDNRN